MIIILSFLVFSFAFSAYALEPCKIVGELKGDADDCQIFYQCTESGWQQLHCPASLFFNEEIKVCDWPKPGTKCGKDDDDHHHSGLEPCENVGDLKPDPENCLNFYQCTNSGWQPLECPAGLFFNDDIKVCDWPVAGTKCGKDDHHNHHHHNHSDLKPCKKEGQKKPDVEHCDLFYECSSCGWSLIKCKAGELFNPKTLLCDKADRVTCAKPNPDPCDDLGDIKADPDHCDLFYECTICGWALVPCGSNLRFNNATGTCDNADQVKCDSDDHHDDDHHDDGHHDDDHHDDDHHDDDHHDDDHHDDDHSTQDPLEPCEEISALKPDPKNCNKFYECTRYGWQNMSCFGKLVFNDEKKLCDYPENVKCVNE